MSNRHRSRTALLAGLCLAFVTPPLAHAETYARYTHDGTTAYGLVDGATIHELSGPPYAGPERTGRSVALEDVALLPPTEAAKVFAVGMNFASHISSPTDAPPPLFLKLPTSLIGHDRDVVVPAEAENLHFEGEMVIVIGKAARNVSVDEAPDHIFGITAGNDLTERSWQSRDLQWMRAKASDGFGPVGPFLVTDSAYDDLLLTTRLNGEIVQQESTANMIHKPAKVVSYLSRNFTLSPGDLIFMGTPGRTQRLSDGDVVTVTIESVGTLSNRIVWPEAER